MAERYHGARSGVSLTDWYAQQLVDDVVLYDITAQTATTLSSLIVKRQLAAPDERHAAHWAARARLVKTQKNALNPEDRTGLIAQQEAWLEEIDALTREPVLASA